LGCGWLGWLKWELRCHLPAVAGGVAPGLEQFRKGEFARAQVDLAALGNPGEDAVAIRSAAGEDGGTRRAADGAGGVGLREAHPLAREGVEVGCLDDRMAVAAEVAPAEVVGEEHEDVRRAGGGGVDATDEQSEEGEGGGTGEHGGGEGVSGPRC
jgi:hypothetical protein